MSKKSIYTCNICNNEIEDLRKSFGVNFSNSDEFTLGGYDCTDDTHICHSCTKQLQTRLAVIQIDDL